MNPVIKFTTLFGPLPVELAVKLTSEVVRASATCFRPFSSASWLFSSDGRFSGCRFWPQRPRRNGFGEGPAPADVRMRRSYLRKSGG